MDHSHEPLKPHEQWIKRAAQLDPQSQLFIAGRFVPATGGETFLAHSPRDGSVLASVSAGTALDIDTAVAAARAAFDDGRWARRSPAERKATMLRWADLVRADADYLGLLEALEAGKPISEALRVDVASTAACLQWYGEAIDKIYGEVGPISDTALATITREPLGVIGAIVPWNYPLIIAAWKIGPALAAGNSVILKPAEASSLSALRLAELATEAGLPDGVFNVVPGRGHQAGAALGAHPDVDALAFTGSGATGRSLLSAAGGSNGKNVSLELGGKSAHIVLADCDDVDAAAEAVAWGIFYNGGQTCNAGSRLLIDRPIADQFVERVVAQAQAIIPGDPLDPTTHLGPLISDAHRAAVHERVERAVAQGATLVTGGRPVEVVPGGSYYAPTVLVDVANTHEVAREEIFGPVLSVITIDGADDAVAVANDSPYGLAGAVWTGHLATGHRVARQLRAGVVWVNTFDHTDVSLPFGGIRGSGHGRDKSLHAFDPYTFLKTTLIHHG